MDSLSRKLNGIYPKVTVKTEKEYHSTNHLLFIDDLKLLSKDEPTLHAMMEETKELFKTIGLKMNKDKSATNGNVCTEDAQLLENRQGYKYLGIIENT